MYHRIVRNLMKFALLLLPFFCANNALYADPLVFKVGDKASYSISQKLNVELALSDETEYTQSEATIALDIKILSSNPQTLSYPFDVEVTLKKIDFFEVQQDGMSSTVTKYGTNSPKTLENHILADHLDKLINHPLIFRVEGAFQVKETTGYLAQINENFYSPSNQGLFGATPWTFELLLTQLFHLSGEKLQLTNSYPVSCYQFLDWEEDADSRLNEQEISLHQSSHYKINQMNSKKIDASWQGNAKIIRLKDGLDGNISLAGNVTWDMANPMIQKRDLTANLEVIDTGSFPLHLKGSIQQTWEATSI